MRWTLVQGLRRGTLEVQQQREGLSDLAEYYGADISGAVLNTRGGHRSHVLALRRGTLCKTVAVIRVDDHFGAAGTDGAGQRYHLHDVRSTRQHPCGGDDDCGTM